MTTEEKVLEGELCRALGATVACVSIWPSGVLDAGSVTRRSAQPT